MTPLFAIGRAIACLERRAAQIDWALLDDAIAQAVAAVHVTPAEVAQDLRGWQPEERARVGVVVDLWRVPNIPVFSANPDEGTLDAVQAHLRSGSVSPALSDALLEFRNAVADVAGNATGGRFFFDPTDEIDVEVDAEGLTVDVWMDVTSA